MKIITITNVKGGVGKTTTAINLAAAIASKGHKVLIIDNDVQSNATEILNVDRLENTIYDIYKDKKVGFDDVIYEVGENLYIIPNSIESAKLEMELYPRMNRESIFKFKKNTIPDIFAFVIIDNSPFLGICTQNALAVSDYYICVIDNSISALQGVVLLQGTVNELRENGVNDNLKILGVLRNRFDKRTTFTRQLNEVLKDTFEGELFNTIIYDSVKFKEAATMHQSIQEYNKTSGSVYDDLYQEIMERINE